MVYESGFTTRRIYSSRPVVSSYSVSYPSYSRVYKSSFPIYSTYTYPRTRIISSPVRVVTSPTRIVTRVIRSPSPPRVISTTRTTRVISSPDRTLYPYYSPWSYYGSSYLPSSYYSSYLPSSYYSSYLPYYSSSYLPSSYLSSYYVPGSHWYSGSPSYLYSPLTRSLSRSLTPSYLKRYPPGYGLRALTNYLGTEPYKTFQEETSRIRYKAQSLIRDIHTPVVRRARSVTPFPISGYPYGPTSQLALDAYIARITNPIRSVAKEVRAMSLYPEVAHKYVGKSHLASIRICGDKVYNIRRPMYDSDKVRTDINLLSWYLRHPEGKSENKVDDVDDNVSIKEVPDLDPFRPSRKFSEPKSAEDVKQDDIKEKQRLRREHLMTVNEEDLDEIELEKKNAQRIDDIKHNEEEDAQDEEDRRRIEEEARLAEAAKQKRIAAQKRIAEEERLAEEARLEEETRLHEAARLAAEERLAEEARLEEETRLHEAARLAEEARLAEKARLAEENRKAEQARLAEEARLAEAERRAEEARLEAEQRMLEQELNRLAELERQAEEEREIEHARQAAELAEIARQEAEIAAEELKHIQEADRYSHPIVDEPQTPVEDLRQEPTIELTTNIDEIRSETTDATGETEYETEEEEETDEE